MHVNLNRNKCKDNLHRLNPSCSKHDEHTRKMTEEHLGISEGSRCAKLTVQEQLQWPVLAPDGEFPTWHKICMCRKKV